MSIEDPPPDAEPLSVAEQLAANELIASALQLAAAAHDGQMRKGSSVPYLTHPIEVSRVLKEHGFDERHAPLHAAALLHDVVEDTPVTLNEIQAVFGNEIANWVDATSEVKLDAAGNKRPWKERKTEHLQRLRPAPWPVHAIVLADKIHNLRDLLSEPRSADYWKLFNAPPDELLWYYRATIDTCRDSGEVASLATTAARLVDQLHAAVDALKSNQH